MNIKSKPVIASLDEDLNLFEEDDWDFLYVSESEINNEYFNDMRDIEFLDRHGTFRALLPVAVLGVLVLISSLWLYSIVTNTKDIGYTNYVASLDGVGRISYVSGGTTVASEDLLQLSGVVQDYCNVVRSRQFGELDDYCAGGSSGFLRQYEAQKNSIVSAYDKYDCWVRMVDKLSEYVRLDRVDNVLTKDGIEYVYAYIVVPDSSSVGDYLNSYKYEMVRNFTNKEVNERTVCEFLLSLLEANKMKVGMEVVELKCFDGKLVNDDKVLGVITDAYDSMISKTFDTIGTGFSS